MDVKKEVTLRVNFRGGTYLQCACTPEWAQDTMQSYRKWLRAKYALTKEDAIAIGPAFFSMFMKYQKDGMTDAELIAEDPTYEKHIDCIFELADVSAITILGDEKVDEMSERLKASHKEYLDLAIKNLKEEMKGDGWREKE